MAQQLGFSDNINYDAQGDTMVKQARTRQNAQTGVSKRRPQQVPPAQGPQDPGMAPGRGAPPPRQASAPKGK
jgi:hypothetical protein